MPCKIRLSTILQALQPFQFERLRKVSLNICSHSPFLNFSKRHVLIFRRIKFSSPLLFSAQSIIIMQCSAKHEETCYSYLPPIFSISLNLQIFNQIQPYILHFTRLKFSQMYLSTSKELRCLNTFVVINFYHQMLSG